MAFHNRIFTRTVLTASTATAAYLSSSQSQTSFSFTPKTTISESPPPSPPNKKIATSLSNRHPSNSDKKPEEPSDVLVIGGGIIGSSLAYFLSSDVNSVIIKETRSQFHPLPPPSSSPPPPPAKPPLKITLLERQTIASEATGLSAGTIWSTGSPMNPTSKESIPTMFGHISTLLFKHLQKTSDLDVEYIGCGGIELCLTPAEVEFGKHEFEHASKLLDDKSNLTWLNSLEEVRKVLPNASDKVLAGMYAKLAGQVNAGLAAHAMTFKSILQGVNVHENAVVTAVEKIKVKGEGMWCVECNDGRRWLSRNVILANGAWVNDCLPFDMEKVGIEPVKGSITVSAEVPSEELKKLGMFPIVYFFEAELDWSIKPPTTPRCLTHYANGDRLTRHGYGRLGKDGRFYFGGDRTVPLNATDYEVDLPMIDELMKEKVYPVVDGLSKYYGEENSIGSWAGIMGFSSDGTHLIGEVDKGLWIVGGFGGDGIMDGPGAAFVVSEVLRGGDSIGVGSEVFDRYDPMRGRKRGEGKV